MRGDDLIINLLYALGAVWLFWIWKQDCLSQLEGKPNERALPGAYPAKIAAMVVAAVGALVLLAVETGGEYALGIAGEQDTIAASFLLAMLAAAIIEEVIFRGFLVVDKKGRAALVGSIVGFSLIFALLHPYLWNFEMPENSWAFWNGAWTWQLDAKGAFSTSIVLLNALWFYAVRFMPNNPQHSLLPCFVAHGVSNLGVFVVKWSQGFVAL